MRWSRTASLVFLAFILAGCKTVASQSHPSLFPTVWPASLDYSIKNVSKSAPHKEPAGPSVRVERIQLDLGDAPAAEPAAPGTPTADVLTGLLVQRLRAAGINASTDEPNPDFRLVPAVPTLIYNQTSARSTLYAAELNCRLADARTRRVLWDKQLRQDFDRQSLVDMMSRMPGDWKELEHRQVLVERCMVPVYDRMAAAVQESVKETAE